ncbi:AEC family transporter [uncultured Brevundimonas sp.]|uniref:AEC family transporter n=1 Tax=uncultured Brevundimonas sp. TaxID=213418 RepID=UPI0025CF11BE|nr:AEC family transporter [uncultured Brevundimonas sp.]
MNAAFDVVLPVFALIGLGFLCRRTKVLGPAAVGEINRFVVWLAQPALLFGITANAHWSSYRLDFIVAVGGALVLTFLLVLAASWRRIGGADAVVDGLSAAYANNGFLGIPLGLLVFGEWSLPFSGVAVIMTACVRYAMGLIGMELGRAAGQGWGRATLKALSAVVRNPMMIAPALGAVVSGFGLTPPQGLTTLLTLLAGAAIPCALVALGLFLAEHAGEGFGDWSWAPLTFAKLVIQPAIAWLLAAPVMHAPPQVVQMAVLMALMPTGAGPFMLAQVYARRGAVASRTILMTTVMSVVAISIFLTLVR